MTLPPTYNFKAIIVGGSVAGLTLAHTFEKANINYVLLEARATISPQLGASIVIMPNGARILDQMGLYDELKESITTPMSTVFQRREDGTLVTSNNWPKIVEERLGYICGICERRQFLKSMYGQLKDKSKVRLSKKVMSIQHNDDSVTVKCADGSEFEGDIVIGADGIHSRTRREMQRYARETGPPGLLGNDENCITATYDCIFGMSDTPMPSLIPGSSHTTTSLNHSSLLFASDQGFPQWFFFSKIDPSTSTSSSTTTTSSSFSPSSTSTSPTSTSTSTTPNPPSIPTYTPTHLKRQLSTHATFRFTPNLTLSALSSISKTISYFPLEEANHEIWTFGRIVCVGDSVHKMTPNLGQGGNQAIESAAVLVSCLVDFLRGREEDVGEKGKFGERGVEEVLREYQDLRKERTRRFVNVSGLVTRNEALETLKHVLRFLYTEPLSGEALADIQTEMYHTAPYLTFLPLPARTRDNELWKKGMKRVKDRNDVPRPKL